MSSVGIKIWNWLKEAGNLISLSFLAFVLIFLFRFAIGGTLFGGSIDSARYLLSALAQTQGAIIAIVISLTIVAVQVSSQAYSLRVTDLLLKYEFFWFMLFLYGLSIIYDVTLLNRINSDNIGSLGSEVNISIFISAIVLWALFPYSKKTLERLRPQTIIRILAKHILASNKGIFDANRRETILPLFDITKKAIRADDIATARDGVKKTEEVCCAIFAEQLSEEEETATAVYFSKQYERTAKIAFIQNDIDSVGEISRSLEVIADNITGEELSMGRSRSVLAITDKLGDIGRLSIERKWEEILGFIADSLSDLSIECARWRTPGAYVSDTKLRGANRLSADVIRDTSNEVLHLLTMLNLESIRVDILLAARNTQRPLVSACAKLIKERLPIPFYEKMCVENILPLVRGIEGLLGVSFDWLPHVADILTALGTKSAETLGKGIPASSLEEYLVWAVATRPSEEPQISQRTFDVTMAHIFNYINEAESDAGAMWLIEALEGIGNEYNRKGLNFPPQSVITHLGYIGSSLGFEKKKFTVALSRKALDSISNVVRGGHDKRLWELAFKASFRIVAETDDKEVRDKALGIFRENSMSTEKSAFKTTVDRCLNEFKAENRADLDVSSERKTRLERFASDLSSIIS